MGASFDIDDEDLRELERKLGNPRQVLADIGRNLAEEAINLIREGWEGQRDPYGAAWKGKKRPDGRAILVGESGALRTGWHITAQGADGFTVASGQSYADIHQDGAPAAGIVPRKMVPNDGDIPGAWEARFDSVTDEIIDEILGR